MNIDQCMFIRQDRIRRFPNSLLAKKDRFMNDPRKRRVLHALQLEISWNNFAASLNNQFPKFGNLSEGQLVAAESFLAKLEKKRFPVKITVDL